MNKLLAIGLLAIVASIGLTTIVSTNTVIAQNEFGQAAAGSAPLGEHSRAGGAACDPPYNTDPLADPPCSGTTKPGRIGIGNTGELVCPNVGKLTPSELAIFLAGGGCPPP